MSITQSFEENDSGLLLPTIKEVNYSVEDLRLFAKNVCSSVNLHSLKQVLEHCKYDEDFLRGYLKSISEGNKHFKDVSVTEDITKTSKEYHQEVYHVMFQVALSDLPLYVNEHIDLKPVVSWRFTIGK